MEFELTAWISGVVLFFAAMLWTLASTLKNKKLLYIFALALILFFSVSYYGVNRIAGIPKYSDLPEKFQLVYFKINEPIDIYLWIVVENNGIPLTYRVEYSDDLRDKLYTIKKQLDGNVPINGNVIDGIGQENAEGTQVEFSEAITGYEKEE